MQKCERRFNSCLSVLRLLEPEERCLRRYGKALCVLLITILIVYGVWLSKVKQFPELEVSSSPIVIIGGGTENERTLIRALLEAHPDINCDAKAEIMLNIISRFKNSSEIGSATEILKKRQDPQARLYCSADPSIIDHAELLLKLLPNSKFILLIENQQTIVSQEQFLLLNKAGSYGTKTWSLHLACNDLGRQRCFPIVYRELIANPEQNLRALVKFMNLSWNNAALAYMQKNQLFANFTLS